MNGGGMTNYFEITRGVRQRCPLSPSLFILTVAELLALKIRQSPNCRGIRLPNDKEARSSQFADETTIITKRLSQITPQNHRSIWGHLRIKIKQEKDQSNVVRFHETQYL